MKEFISIIENLPDWSVYLIFITYIFIMLKIFFKIFDSALFSLNNNISLSTANEKLSLVKLIGYVSLFVTILVYCFLSMCFSILLPKLILLLIGIIQIVYIKSAINLLDHIISIKHAPHTLEKLEYTCLCGEIITEKGSLYLDYTFSEEKIKL